jgi:AraC-like DNA-binding protein
MSNIPEIEGILQINDIEQYNDLFGFETLHPLVNIVDFIDPFHKNYKMTMGFYSIFLKETKGCILDYGKTIYDYDEDTIVAFGPEQTVGINYVKDAQPKSTGLLFHPDFIRGTELGRNIKKYTFFSYESNEALHLSPNEQEVIKSCLNIIRTELHHAIDRHTRTLITTNIKLLLDYCLRFYDRQFIMREDINHGVLARFEQLVDDYIDSGKAEKEGLPSVKYFAEKVFLSPNYFGDLVKRETGKTAKEYIQLKTLDVAKERLLSPKYSITQISEQLGFQYPQHFIRFFKKHEGITPNQYRYALS